MASVLILGAQSDIAIAIARAMAEEGYEVYLAGRNQEALTALATDLHIRYGIRASVHFFDALQYPTHPALINDLPSLPEVTICCFGYLGDQGKGQEDWEEAARILHTNYTGAVSVLNAVATAYTYRRSGIIVGISSVAGDRGRGSNYLYGSAKAGFTAYLSGLRNRLYPLGVTVITVLPGFVATKMTENLPLPAALTASATQVAQKVARAVRQKKDKVYVKGMWRWIMWIIRSVPEGMFKKMKL